MNADMLVVLYFIYFHMDRDINLGGERSQQSFCRNGPFYKWKDIERAP